MTNIFDLTSRFTISKADASAMLDALLPGKKFSKMKILDVGCRLGELVGVLHDRGADVFGIDISASCIKTAVGLQPKLKHKFSCADVRDLGSFSEHDFDLIVCIGVFPYLNEREQIEALRQLQTRCKAAAQILILFQKPKAWPVNMLACAISLIPIQVYGYLAWILTLFIWPFSSMFLNRSNGVWNVHYRISLSLHGIHFGYPKMLEKYELGFTDCQFVSTRNTACFLIPAGELSI